MQHTPTLEDVRGRWFIVQTSLNLWRKRQNPSITYTPLDAQRMHDDVQYTINKKTKHIIGIDTQNVADPRRFRWHGSAWYIRWVTSDWRIVEFNQAGGWCVVYFSHTVFTAAGVDIYARNKHMSHATITMIKQHMTDPAVRPFVDQLYRPQHD